GKLDGDLADLGTGRGRLRARPRVSQPRGGTRGKRSFSMGLEDVVFFIAAIGALAGAIGVIAARNPFYSVLFLVVHLFMLAALFLLLEAQFVAAAQIVVYAGAVMVLYVFVTAYVGGIEEPIWEPIPGQRLIAPLVAAALFIELSIAVLGTGLTALGTDGPDISSDFGTPT